MSKISRIDIPHLAAGRSEGSLYSVKTVRRFLADETGATAIEYGLIAAGIALAIIASVTGLGTKLTLQLRFLRSSESMGNHDSNIVDAGSVDRRDASVVGGVAS